MTISAQPQANPLVRARGLSQTFPNGVAALQGLNLDLAPGEFVSVVGPSGCGKSTLLHLMAGLNTSFSGELSIGGVTPEKARRDAHPMAFVFQQPTLLPWRTVARNVALPLELERVPRAGHQAVVLPVLERVGLADFAHAYPHQLSGGMQMRVSVARALITHPRLLLMDEPFAALDEITRQSLHEELLRLWGLEEFTAVFVTHNVFEAVFLSQRVLVMSGRPGRIVADITVPFPYPRPPELRSQAEFARVVGEVSQCLRSAHS